MSPSIDARATMPCLNSSGNVASEASSTPSARRPFQVNATVTQRLSLSTEVLTSAADCTLSRMPASQARPPAGFRKVRNSYRPVRAGVRVSRLCWISSNSSITLSPDPLLHLVEHVGEGSLDLEGLLDFVGAHIRIFPVFQETRALVLAYELDECRSIRLPVLGKPLEVFKHRPDAELREEAHGIFGVLVEVGVEDSLIHEVGFTFDVEEHPAQVVQLEYGKRIGCLGHCLFNGFSILADDVLPSGLDLRNNGEAVARGSLRKYRAVAPLFFLVFEESLFRDRHGCGFRPVVSHVSRPFVFVAGLRPAFRGFRVVRHRPIVVVQGGLRDHGTSHTGQWPE